MVEKFKAEIKDGKIFIKPRIEKTTNAQGGTDVTIHLPSPLKIQAVAQEVKDGKRNIQQI